jgi:hypothetical protein
VLDSAKLAVALPLLSLAMAASSTCCKGAACRLPNSCSWKRSRAACLAASSAYSKEHRYGRCCLTSSRPCICAHAAYQFMLGVQLGVHSRGSLLAISPRTTAKAYSNQVLFRPSTCMLSVRDIARRVPNASYVSQLQSAALNCPRSSCL